MTRHCEVCDAEFPYGGRRTRRKFCSTQCRSRAMNAKEWDREPNPPENRERKCICGMRFMPVRITQKFCTKACRSRLYANRRRGGGLSLRDLWYRDHGVCYLCNRLVDLSIAYPDDHAATFEHRIPLSRGGTNERTNVALAHWRCNREKGIS